MNKILESMETKEAPIRVLHIVGRMDCGGIETMIMNLYRNIDRDKVQFDFLAHYGREAFYNDEIRSLGGKIYEMPALKDEKHVYYWRLIKYVVELHKFFRNHNYKIIHGHMTNTASIYMPIAKKYSVNCRIAHSHSTHGKAGLLGIVTNILQKPIYKSTTDWFACSKAAANWFYPKEAIEAGRIIVVPNAVDALKFRFNKEIRNKIRKALGVDNKLVIGCVARFRTEKNQAFLLDVHNEILNIEKNAVLMFAGDGPCEDEVKAKAVKLGIQEKVVFLGMRNDIPDILQAMDVLAMPSIFEGLPVTGIEAQASGLRIVASTGVPDELNALDMVEYLSLDTSLKEWAEHLVKAAKLPREDTYGRLKIAGYDINTTTPWLQAFYINKETNREK